MKSTAMARKKILVVDDDMEMTSLMKEILETRHYDVVVANEGGEAIRRSQEEVFDLVLLDLSMPFFSGFWFCDAFKQKMESQNTPVIIVTGLAGRENMEKAYRVGAAAYFRKPFRSEQLLEIIEKVLSLHQVFGEDKEGPYHEKARFMRSVPQTIMKTLGSHIAKNGLK